MPIVARDASLLIVRGADALNFIDGLSTNLVKNLQSGSHVQTVFTDRNARIIDLCTCYHMDSFIVLIGHNQNRENLLTHLNGRILTSDVQISDATENNDFFIEITEETKEYSKGITALRIAESEVLLVASKGTGPDADMNREQWNEWRIQEVRPDVGHEISNKCHPFSCGLEHLVHQEKGCYIGQEILVRMRSRGTIGRGLQRVENGSCKPNFVTTKGKSHCLAIVRINSRESQ
ncbi:MAG: CAF17-like 4Fe-4S cluster assembly/insertion protein YgfZ [Candidatus Poseidoniales archaeon]|jgi:folate-binding protein YgfZ